jgi:glycosyltransferase involved in cell wall biosynthesis
MKKALIVMPTPPFPALGADEQNRLGVVRLLKELGYTDISIIAKARADQMKSWPAEEAAYGAVTLVPYRNASEKTLRYRLARLLNPFRWDGAADEYFDNRLDAAVAADIARRKPDLVLLEYNFVWPVARALQRARIPIVMRSHNFEALHFLSEDGVSPVNLFKFFAKLLTEWRSCTIAGAVLAVTATEAREYRWLCPAGKIFALHSGALPDLLLKRHQAREQSPVELLFMGSRYSIPHNRKAAAFLIEEVMPAVERAYPGMFHLSVTGGKLPEKLARALPANTTYLGYVDDLDAVFERIEAVVSPRVAGHGMQLKVFEPLCRGIPVVTSASVLGGYPFETGKEVLIADTVPEFVRAVGQLTELAPRRAMGEAAHARAAALFGKDTTLAIMRASLHRAGAV